MKPALAKIDLNLLKALHALMEERSVGCAAERLFVTPSAMSKALLRLRDLFNDPLFVRSHGTLVPTTRAEAILPSLHAAIESLQACLGATDFDPAASEQRFRIAAPEQFAPCLIPGLMARMRQAAPRMTLELVPLATDYRERLVAGGLDFAIDLEQSMSEGFSSHRLYSAKPVICYRRGHPLHGRRTIDSADVCGFPQITFLAQNMTVDGLRRAERLMQTHGLNRKPLLDTTHLLVAIDLLLSSDALMLVPDCLLRLPLLQTQVEHRPAEHIPLFSARIDISLVRHERVTRSAPHQWILNQAMAAMAFEASPES